MSNVVVIFEPSGLRVLVEKGTTALEAAHKVGLHVSSDCGGRGNCGKCRVIVHPAGTPSTSELEHLSEEEIENGFRLCCKFQIKDQTRVLMQRNKGYVKILTTSEAREWEVDSGPDNQYGIAIDLGTTTIVAYLLDLSSGVQIAQVQSLNPQTAFGEDIMSRITYASRERDGSKILQQRVVNEFNLQISQLLERTGINQNQTTRIAIVGNTAMQHLLLAANTDSLGRAPYQPSIFGPTTMNPQQIGIKMVDSSELYIPPNIAGFVGGDTVGFILSQRLDQVDDVVLGIDIGTNGEIVLSDRGKMYCCSAAAGPAFEGATILHGMRGQSGAIEYLSIPHIDEKPEISIIGDNPPRGLCGSAIVDIVAELHRTGIVDDSGRMHKKSKRVQDIEKQGHSYMVVKEDETVDGNRILFTQKDVRQVQLAKAAIQTGITVLLDTIGKDVSEIDRVLLAGAFGNYIRPESAMAIGLLPKVGVSKVIPVGNAAGEGAKGLLLSKKSRALAEKLVTETQYIELASQERFQEVFLKSISLL
ncbi:MAG: ASKHA domain-containing protein [Candidatus Thorarchaeota archaeon]|nr:ASKHA domain-containing protein [Candidatus Thorarchaeota archaeon]